MNILVVNDDGIHSNGLLLARIASKIGNVWVVAPNEECSGMSHRITVYGVIDVIEESIPVDNVRHIALQVHQLALKLELIKSCRENQI